MIASFAQKDTIIMAISKSKFENRDHKNNGGLKRIIIQPAKKTIRPIKKNIKFKRNL